MKIKFGSIVVAGSGKVGGHVASRNRAGSYIRTKVTPVNPGTSYQSAVRNRLSSLATGWAGLTAAQRAGWNAGVADFKKTNVFGDTVLSSGFNLYCKLNANLLFAGAAEIDTCPKPVAIAAITSLTLTGAAGAGSLSLAFAPSPVGADTRMMIEATPVMGAGKTFVKNQFRNISYVDAAGTTPKDLAAAYVAKFGAISPAGSKIWVRCKIIDKVTGQAGIPIVTSCVLSA